MYSFLLAIIYISFVSLGLPDALLGAAWPIMHTEFSVPVSYMGILSMTISLGTIVSSLLADRLTKHFGTGKLTAISVAVTAAALLGFSRSGSFWMLFLWAVPYGLGAGGVDASLNNYVAVHYASRHMSWLHCMWGLGACTGPYIMGYALVNGAQWNAGYACIGVFQCLLTAVLLCSLPMWKQGSRAEAHASGAAKPLKLKEIFSIPGAKEAMTGFFGYCAIEQTAGQWASSYLVMKDGIGAEEAAGLASLFYIGITVGRAVSGFLTIRFNDKQMIRIGQGVITAGIAVMLLPFGKTITMFGLIMIGLGCAPVYPCIIHSTPEHFGADKSQAIIGVQMASAYVGTLIMPPLFGLIAEHISAGLLPVYLLAILCIMFLMLERLNRTCAKNRTSG